jgi:hypothetical protein
MLRAANSDSVPKKAPVTTAPSSVRMNCVAKARERVGSAMRDCQVLKAVALARAVPAWML